MTAAKLVDLNAGLTDGTAVIKSLVSECSRACRTYSYTDEAIPSIVEPYVGAEGWNTLLEGLLGTRVCVRGHRHIGGFLGKY